MKEDKSNNNMEKTFLFYVETGMMGGDKVMRRKLYEINDVKKFDEVFDMKKHPHSFTVCVKGKNDKEINDILKEVDQEFLKKQGAVLMK